MARAELAPALRPSAAPGPGRPRRSPGGHAGRIRQRPEQVHDRGDSELLPHRARRAAWPGGRSGRTGRRAPPRAAPSAARSAASSMSTPSASSTSAEPEREVKLRLPCLATGTPAPATTNAAAVEMLSVPTRPPPVPQVSTRQSGALHRQPHHGAAQRPGRAGDLVRRLALGPEPHEQGGGLDRRGLAPHQHGERGRRRLAGERGPPGELLDGVSQRGVVGHGQAGGWRDRASREKRTRETGFCQMGQGFA